MENVKREQDSTVQDDNQVSRMSFSDDGDSSGGDSDSSSVWNTSPRAKRRRRAPPREQRDLSVSKTQRGQLIRSLVNFRQDRAFTDYKIIVDGHPPIHVHKLIMAAASAFFKRVLESGMQEALSGEIHMKEVSYETVEILVAFSYGQPFEINSENAQEVLEAADCYEYSLLKLHCEQFLLNNIDGQNCFDFLQLAELRQLYLLKEKTMLYALEHFDVVTEADDFLRVPLPILTEYLSDDRINTKREEQIFFAGVKWLKVNETRKADAYQVLKCTRLALLAPRFLLDFVKNDDLFKEFWFSSCYIF